MCDHGPFMTEQIKQSDKIQMAERVNVKAHPSQLSLPKVDSNVLLELFPFAIILDHNMRISKCGEKLLETYIQQNPHKKPSTFYDGCVTSHMKLRRPKGIDFNWATVVLMQTVIFELELIRADDPKVVDLLGVDESMADIAQNMSLADDVGGHIDAEAAAVAPEDIPDAVGAGSKGGRAQGNYRLLLKGQMRYIADIDAIVFLCSPV